jgi:exodeoxyribonuclease V beta subunit
LRQLLGEKGTLFKYLSEGNRKKRAPVIEFLHYPQFFDWVIEEIYPLIQEAVKPKNILRALKGAWGPVVEPLLLAEGWLGPDEILSQMKEALHREKFASQIRKKYAAAIIDEFQDTDPVQWDIFKRLFLDPQHPLQALYLVGDPKQSIYRFRKADVYTYFEAREVLGEGSLYCLDTNYRSSKSLIGSLNALFQRSWLPLPKIQREIPYIQIQAGSSVDSELGDGKGAVHFMIGRGDDSLSAEYFLSYTLSEIQKLFPSLSSYSSFAILVKDRFQAQSALHLLQAHGVPAVAKSSVAIGQTFAVQAFKELIIALASPRDVAKMRVAELGPYKSAALIESLSLLEEKGLAPFLKRLLKDVEDSSLKADFLQLTEDLLLWEKKEGFSIDGILRYLRDLEHLDADQGGRRRVDAEEDAVQILTQHISKGLEFEVVFAVGLAVRSPESDEETEELDAEKLRQLYVVMTRAKRRLYVPLSLSEKNSREGSRSPMELFSSRVESQEGSFTAYLNKLSKQESLSYEEILPILTPKPQVPLEIRKKEPQATVAAPHPSPSFLYSFTSLAKTSEKAAPLEPAALSTLPRGAETGTIIHAIFEELFSQPTPIWRDSSALRALIAHELRFSSLLPWENEICEMIEKTLTLPLNVDGEIFSLSELDPKDLQAEMEFVFSEPPHYVVGFIDLVFCRKGKYSIVDWKTNWLEDYHFLEDAMSSHDYWLQAALYAEGLKRHVKQLYNRPFEELFGGSIYLFVRGPGACCFKPDLNLIQKTFYGK